MGQGTGGRGQGTGDRGQNTKYRGSGVAPGHWSLGFLV